MRGGELGNQKKKVKFVPKRVLEKPMVEGRCVKYGRGNHLARNCKAQSRAKR